MDRYNDLLIRCSSENIDGFTVYMRGDTEEEYKDLTPVYEYLKERVDENKIVREDAVIIGETLSSLKKV